MSKLLKIDSILFYTGNLEESAKFYEDILGLRRRWADEENKMIGFTFEGSDSEIVIHNDTRLPKFSYSFLVDNVFDFCSEFKKKGYLILKEPFDVRTGKFAVLADPSGNEIPIIDLTKFGGIPRYDQ